MFGHANALVTASPVWQGITALNRSFTRLVAFFESDPHSAALMLPHLHSTRMHTSYFYDEVLDIVTDAFPVNKSARTESAKATVPALRHQASKLASSTPSQPPTNPIVAAVKPVVVPKGSDDEDSDDSSEPYVCTGISCSGCSTCSGP